MSAFWLTLPLLAVSFVVGIVMSLLQIVTSIQDAAFATVPRLVVLLVALVLLLPWMLMRLMSYTTGLLGGLERYASG